MSAVDMAGSPSLALVPGEEETMLRESVRGIAGRFGPGYWQQVCREHRHPAELWQALAEKGFLSVHLPEGHGGGGLGLYHLAAVLEEVATAGCPMPFIIVSPGIVGMILARHGTDAQKREWLAPIASGEKLIAFAITEPDAGSNSHKLTTAAERRGDRYVINGQKYYITGVEHADAVLVVTRTGTSPSGRGQLSLFLVDTDAPGLTRQPIETAVLEPDSQSTLFFDNVEVSADRLVGVEHEGLRVAFDGMNPERILFAAVMNGIARYALDKACAYARERAVWGKPIGTHQAIAHPLAEGKIMLDQARLMTRAAAILFDARADAGEAANTAKFAASEAALHCLDHAIQTHGGNGMAAEYQLTNYWFLARMVRIGPVSREMVLNFIAEHSLGLPRSY